MSDNAIELEEELAYQIQSIYGLNEGYFLLTFFARKSLNAIKKYCGIEQIPEDLHHAVIELAYHYYKNRDNTGIVQQSQGSRSATYKDGIPESIKDVLPLPKVRLM